MAKLKQARQLDGDVLDRLRFCRRNMVVTTAVLDDAIALIERLQGQAAKQRKDRQ